jgi:hypothetical protein
LVKGANQAATVRRPRRRALAVAVVLLAVGAAAAGFLLLRGKRSAEDAPVTAPGASLVHLEGRWLRPDGGYVLEIRKVYASGSAEVAYFNPSPIRVAKAVATGDASSATVFVELQDVNYPGCTYTLTFDPQRDILEGVYYQAMLRQSYDVVFTRLPK